MAETLVKKQKSLISSCSVIEPTDGEQKNLLGDLQKGKATTGIFLQGGAQTSAAGR